MDSSENLISRSSLIWIFYAQQSMKFIQLINVKMPTIVIVDILTFICWINTDLRVLKQEKYLLYSI